MLVLARGPRGARRRAGSVVAGRSSSAGTTSTGVLVDRRLRSATMCHEVATPVTRTCPPAVGGSVAATVADCGVLAPQLRPDGPPRSARGGRPRADPNAASRDEAAPRSPCRAPSTLSRAAGWRGRGGSGACQSAGQEAERRGAGRWGIVRSQPGGRSRRRWTARPRCSLLRGDRAATDLIEQGGQDSRARGRRGAGSTGTREPAFCPAPGPSQ